MSKSKIDKFKSFWLKEIEKIQKRAIDSRGTYLIMLDFDMNKQIFKMGMDNSEFTHDAWLELEMLESQVRIALETARSRYKLQNRSLWARIVEGIAGIVYNLRRASH